MEQRALRRIRQAHRRQAQGYGAARKSVEEQGREYLRIAMGYIGTLGRGGKSFDHNRNFLTISSILP
jgi:hypothetical protein